MNQRPKGERSDEPRDAHLAAALRHAPDENVQPGVALDQAILAAALAQHAALPAPSAARRSPPVARTSPWQRLWAPLWQWIGSAGAAPGLALAAVMTLGVGVWIGREPPPLVADEAPTAILSDTKSAGTSPAASVSASRDALRAQPPQQVAAAAAPVPPATPATDAASRRTAPATAKTLGRSTADASTHQAPSVAAQHDSAPAATLPMAAPSPAPVAAPPALPAITAAPAEAAPATASPATASPATASPAPASPAPAAAPARVAPGPPSTAAASSSQSLPARMSLAEVNAERRLAAPARLMADRAGAIPPQLAALRAPGASDDWQLRAADGSLRALSPALRQALEVLAQATWRAAPAAGDSAASQPATATATDLHLQWWSQGRPVVSFSLLQTEVIWLEQRSKAHWRATLEPQAMQALRRLLLA